MHSHKQAQILTLEEKKTDKNVCELIVSLTVQ